MEEIAKWGMASLLATVGVFGALLLWNIVTTIITRFKIITCQCKQIKLLKEQIDQLKIDDLERD